MRAPDVMTDHPPAEETQGPVASARSLSWGCTGPHSALPKASRSASATSRPRGLPRTGLIGFPRSWPYRLHESMRGASAVVTWAPVLQVGG